MDSSAIARLLTLSREGRTPISTAQWSVAYEATFGEPLVSKPLLSPVWAVDPDADDLVVFSERIIRSSIGKQGIGAVSDHIIDNLQVDDWLQIKAGFTPTETARIVAAIRQDYFIHIGSPPNTASLVQPARRAAQLVVDRVFEHVRK